MTHELNSTDRLLAEVTALRIVLQRVLFQLAHQTGDHEAILREEHASALADLERVRFVGFSQERTEAIHAHAQKVLDEVHTAMRPRPPER